jgi:hypothetical protein
VLSDDANRVLRLAATVFASGLVFHTIDHFRRGVDQVTRHVLFAGNVLTLVSIVTIALIVTRHRLAPVVAMVVGFTAAVGVSAAHLLPTWSAFSDSLAEHHVDGMSWAAVLIEIVGALLLGLAGAYALGRTQRFGAGLPA